MKVERYTLSKEIATIVAKHFREVEKSIQPALNVEAEHGLTGIGTRYNLPEGLELDELHAYASLTVPLYKNKVIRKIFMALCDPFHECSRVGGDETTKLRQVFHAIAVRNPELEGLRFDRDDQWALWHVVCGIASSFNRHDIQFLLDTGSQRNALRDKTYKDLFEKVSAQAGHRLGWVPAPTTLEKIGAQLRQANAVIS